MNIETAKDLQSSLMWRDFVGEIDLKIKGIENQLRTCSAQSLPSLQARIKAFEEVKQIPQMVIDREEQEPL